MNDKEKETKDDPLAAILRELKSINATLSEHSKALSDLKKMERTLRADLAYSEGVGGTSPRYRALGVSITGAGTLARHQDSYDPME